METKTEVAGISKIFFATSEKLGNILSFIFHQKMVYLLKYLR